MRPLLFVVLIAVCLSAVPAIAQEPVYPVDIQADYVSYRFLSGDVIEVTTTITVQSSHGDPWWVESFFDVYLGVENTPCRQPLNISGSSNDCGVDPDCNNPCDIQVSGGELVWDYCNIWHTWTGVGCDPNDPEGTCMPLDYCACGAQYVFVVVLPYDGEEGEIYIATDPTGLVMEADETNNTCSAPLYAPEPVEPIDLQADSVLYSFPALGTIELTAYFTVHASHGALPSYSSSIELFLGTQSVYSASMSATIPTNDCGEDPDCNDDCAIEVEPGNVVWERCDIWHTWMGAGCDPNSPAGTCYPIDLCACGAQYEVVVTVPYDGEEEFIAVVDGVGYVPEGDETNNVCHAYLVPVSVQSTTWGAIKSLFH